MSSNKVPPMRQVKQKLQAGKLVTVVGIAHASPGLVEQVAQNGFDVSLIDCEKYNFTTERIEDMARAGRASGIATVVRPWLNEPGLISRCLDLGAEGIMMAGTDTVDAVQRLVDAVRYARYQDYADKLIVAMIESPEGVQRLPELLKVEGVDVWSIGANDMAQRMGLPGQTNDPRVQQLVDHAIKTIVAGGRTCGMQGTFGNASQRVAQGVRYLSTTVNLLLEQGAACFHKLLPHQP